MEVIVTGTDKIKDAAPPKPTLGLMDWFKTGNIAAWFIMKALEPSILFRVGDRNKTLEAPEKFGLKGYRAENLHLDTGETVTSWYKPAKNGNPTIVYCHGHDKYLSLRAEILKEFSNRDFGVMIAAYPGFIGHEKRPGVAPSEEGCYATGHAMVRDLIFNKRIGMNKIVLYGESLGAAVALKTAHLIEQGAESSGYRLAEHKEKAPPVICFGAFRSLPAIAQEKVPLLPADALIQNRFPSDEIIGDIKSPILLIHGKEDAYTPPKHSQDLEKLSKDGSGSAKVALLDGVNHFLTRPSTKPGKKWEKDPNQIREVVNCAQQFMSDLGLCKPPSKLGKHTGGGESFHERLTDHREFDRLERIKESRKSDRITR